MAATVRVIVVNTDEEAAPELRSHLLSIDGVKIVAEVDEPALLAQAIEQFPAEVLLLHLDPVPQTIMDAVVPLLEACKDRIAAIAMTENRDAELVMRAMRAGMREFLWKPFPPEQLNDILKRLSIEGAGGAKRLGRLLPVVGTCGGAGATTLAANLAVELAQLETWRGAGPKGGGPRVTIVDLDFRFGQVAMLLDAQPTWTIAELCDAPEQIDSRMIERAMVKHPSGVQVLAHPADPQKSARISAAQTAGVLAALLEHFDFVVVDGPVRFDATARAVFDMTDLYLVVLQLLVPSVRNTDRYLQDLASSGYTMERVRLVCNRHGREAGYLEPADVETTLGRKLDWFVPDDWKTSSTAVNMGAPLVSYAPKSKLRLAYRTIAQAIAGGADEAAADLPADAGDGSKKGLFSFFAS